MRIMKYLQVELVKQLVVGWQPTVPYWVQLMNRDSESFTNKNKNKELPEVTNLEESIEPTNICWPCFTIPRRRFSESRWKEYKCTICC